MFFTRHQDDRVRKLENEVAALLAKADAAERTEQSLLSMLKDAQETNRQQHFTFQLLASQYSDGLERARKVQEQAEAALANPQWANAPLHVTEDEEDLKWQADNGIISQGQLADMLSEAGLDPNITRL